MRKLWIWLKGKKTVLFALANITVGILSYVEQHDVIGKLVRTPEAVVVWSTLSGIALLVLRTLTSTPVLDSNPKEK